MSRRRRTQVATVGGGITNCLFKVVHPDAQRSQPVPGAQPQRAPEPAPGAEAPAAAAPQPAQARGGSGAAAHVPHPTALVRKFGENTEVFISRDAEHAVLPQLNAAGFGAAMLGTFRNGRVEAWLRAATLEPADMSHPALVPKIAARLAEFHAAPVQLRAREPQLWQRLREWLDLARGLTFEDPQATRAHGQIDFDSMQRELQQVERLCERTQSPHVLCHNDLLSGNILVMGYPAGTSVAHIVQHDPDVTLQLIDFEYSCLSFRGYDWGNHFNEYAGFECHWHNLPSLAQQRAFLTAYLRRTKQLQGFEDCTVPEGEVAHALAEAAAFTQASHIYWGIWSILQAKFSSIDFDYMGYSSMKWARYHDCKAAVEAHVAQQFPDAP